MPGEMRGGVRGMQKHEERLQCVEQLNGKNGGDFTYGFILRFKLYVCGNVGMCSECVYVL